MRGRMLLTPPIVRLRSDASLHIVPQPEFELVCVFGRHAVALALDVNDAGRSSTLIGRSTHGRSDVSS